MMRAFLASLMMICLLHLQLGNFDQKNFLGWNNAYAAQTATVTQAVATANSTGRFGVKPEEMDLSGAGGFAEILVMVAVGLVGRGLILCQGAFWQTEVMLYVAGAVAFIAGEVVAFMKFNSAQKKLGAEIELSKNLTGDQREALVKMKQTLEEMKSAAKMKYTLQMAASTAFTLAAGVAAYKYYQLYSLRSACVSAEATGAASVYLSATCAPGLAAATAQLTKLTAADSAPAPSAVININKGTIVTSTAPAMLACPTGLGICTTSIFNEKLSWIVCAPPITGGLSFPLQSKEWAPYFASIFKENRKDFLPSKSVDHHKMTNKFLDLLISRAEASALPMLGLGVGAIAMLTAFVFTQSVLVDQWIHGPLGRSIVFGLTAALAIASSMATKGIITKIEERIKKIDEILSAAGVSDVSLLARGGDLKADGSRYSINDKIPLGANSAIDSASRYPCVGNPSTPSSEAGAVPKTSNGCSSLAALMWKSPTQNGKISGFDLKTLGAEFMSAANSATGLADSIQGASSMSGATLNEAQSIGGKLAFAQNALMKTQKALNDQLSKEGKRPIDFLGLRKDLLGKMRAGMMQDLKKQNLTPLQAMEKLGTSPLASDKDSKASSTNPQTNSTDPYSQNIQSVQVDGFGSSKTNEMNLDGEAIKSDDTLVIGKDDSRPGEEIIDRPDSSLFQIISVRYLKTGMGRLGVLTKTPPASSSKAEEKK